MPQTLAFTANAYIAPHGQPRKTATLRAEIPVSCGYYKCDGRTISVHGRVRAHLNSGWFVAPPVEHIVTPDELTRVYKAHNGMVERQAMRVLRDPSHAQDVAHEVFLHLIRYAAQHEIENVTALLHRMATQHAIQALRSRASHTKVDESNVPNTERPQDIDAWRIFHKTLQTCDPVRAQVAFHYFVDGMTQDEIAALLETTRRVVGRHLDRFCDKAQRFTGVAPVDNDDADNVAEAAVRAR